MSIQSILERGNKGLSNLRNIIFILFLGSATAGLVAQTVKIVHSFDGTDGEFPSYVVLTQGRDGRMYGTTRLGGASNMGTIFKQRTTGNVNVVLHAFSGSDGGVPYHGLTLARDGNYYGATNSGGDQSMGTVFKITAGGVITVLHSFTGADDGAFPIAQPIEALDGNLYGTTLGSSSQAATVYKLASSGNLTPFYTLTQDDGYGIFAPLLQGLDGSIYVVADLGGVFGCGSILKLSKDGVLKNKHTFNCRSGGAIPNDLVQTADGTIYGTTQAGGEFGGGTIFKLDSKGVVTLLYSFGANLTDGLNPNGGLTPGTDGNFYSSTENGGANGAGSLFKFTTGGVYTQLYSFPKVKGSTQAPVAAPTQHTSGLFYGVAAGGGLNGLGSIYTLDMGLGPFITFVRPQGKVGATAQILGTALTGATSVTFNGIKADTFKVVSDTYMTATVPSGATTGKVVVTTPGGSLTSNLDFRISK